MQKSEGIYVPSLYEVRYQKDGTIAAFTPVYDDIPATIKKQVDMDLTGSVYPEKPVVPFIKATQDRVVLEIQRGCIRGCRFCQAGMIYRPNREKGVKRLKELAQTMLASTGCEEISRKCLCDYLIILSICFLDAISGTLLHIMYGKQL